MTPGQEAPLVGDTLPPGATAASAFASALRAAIGASGLPLEQIQARLRKDGTHLSLATLSYWQSGRRVPGRRSSLVALGHLEDVLGAAPGSLCQHIAPHGGSRGVNSTSTFAASMGDDIEVPQLVAQLDARLRRQFEMVGEHAIVTVGADRTQHSRSTRRIMRAVADGVDRLLLADLVDDDVPAPTVVPLTHCTLGDRHLLTKSRFVITELLFDRVLSKNESMMLEYRLDYGPPHPLDSCHEVRKQMPLRNFAMEVRFHADAVPARCEWYTYSSHDSATVNKVQVLYPDRSNSVLVVRHAVHHTRFGLRWFWD